jgi:hypothetical protein
MHGAKFVAHDETVNVMFGALMTLLTVTLAQGTDPFFLGEILEGGTGISPLQLHDNECPNVHCRVSSLKVFEGGSSVVGKATEERVHAVHSTMRNLFHVAAPFSTHGQSWTLIITVPRRCFTGTSPTGLKSLGTQSYETRPLPLIFYTSQLFPSVPFGLWLTPDLRESYRTI